MDFSQPTQRQQGDPDTDSKGIDEDGHSQHDLAAGEPVGDHFAHENIQQDAARSRQHTTREDHPVILGQPKNCAAERHEDEAEADHALVAEALAEQAAGYGKEDAGQHVEPDEEADIRKADAEILAQQRRDRRQRLKLEPQAYARDREDGKGNPACIHEEAERSKWLGSIALLDANGLRILLNCAMRRQSRLGHQPVPQDAERLPPQPTGHAEFSSLA